MMWMKYFLPGLLMLSLASCHSGGGSGPGTAATPPTVQPSTPAPAPTPAPASVDSADLASIPDLLPTMYYVPQETSVSCKGTYGTNSPAYTGSEKTNVLDLKGNVIATVCTRFYRFLLMEGTAILRDRGAGPLTVNYGGRQGDERRYRLLDRCAYGEGVRLGLCLIPYHTIAADNTVHKIGDIIYIPAVDGMRLPDGSLHEGFFVVRDTGGAFDGIGSQRVDLFTGLEPDYNNVFSRAGFDHHKPLKAFKLRGGSAKLIEQRLKDQFGDLF